MKKALVLVLCVLGFILIAAPTAVEYHPVLLNGKPFGNAVVVQGGIIAVSLEDFARAGGSGPTLEPNFRLQGNKLIAVSMDSSQASKYDPVKIKQGELVPAVTPQVKLQPALKIKMAPGQLFRVQNGGQISVRLFMLNGKSYIPIEDVAKAFGDGSVRVSDAQPWDRPNPELKLKPGTNIEIHFTSNPRGILVGL